MKPVLILYATRHGQARRVALHVSAELFKRNIVPVVFDARALPVSFDMAAYSAAVLVASVQYGRHESEMTSFVTKYRSALHQMSTAFLSVSGSEATAEDTGAPAETRRNASQQVDAAIEKLTRTTGFYPGFTLPVAGAMAYTKYNFAVRFVIRRMARRSGRVLDTSRDTEYTDWPAVDRFVQSFAAALASGTAGPAEKKRQRQAVCESG